MGSGTPSSNMPFYINTSYGIAECSTSIKLYKFRNLIDSKEGWEKNMEAVKSWGYRLI